MQILSLLAFLFIAVIEELQLKELQEGKLRERFMFPVPTVKPGCKYLMMVLFLLG